MKQGVHSMYNKRVLFTGKGLQDASSKVEECMEDIVVIVNMDNDTFFIETCITDVLQNLNCQYKDTKGLVIDWEKQEIEIYNEYGYQLLWFKIFNSTGVSIVSHISGGNMLNLSNDLMKNIWFGDEGELFFEDIGRFTA